MVWIGNDGDKGEDKTGVDGKDVGVGKE